MATMKPIDFEIIADDQGRISLDDHLDVRGLCPTYCIRKGSQYLYIVRVDNNMYFQTVQNGQSCKTNRNTFARFPYSSQLGANSSAQAAISAAVKTEYHLLGGYCEPLPTSVINSGFLGIKMYYAGLYGKPLIANPFDPKYEHLPFLEVPSIPENESEIKPHMNIKKYLEEL